MKINLADMTVQDGLELAEKIQEARKKAEKYAGLHEFAMLNLMQGNPPFKPEDLAQFNLTQEDSEFYFKRTAMIWAAMALLEPIAMLAMLKMGEQAIEDLKIELKNRKLQ